MGTREILGKALRPNLGKISTLNQETNYTKKYFHPQRRKGRVDGGEGGVAILIVFEYTTC
jgi:hypothetical protein